MPSSNVYFFPSLSAPHRTPRAMYQKLQIGAFLAKGSIEGFKSAIAEG